MSFISAFKRAFGFGADEPLYDREDRITEDEDVQVHNGNDSHDLDITTNMPDVPVASAEMKAKIFEDVVAVFNQALPDFLSKSVDPAAQQRLLVESIDKSVDSYLDNLLIQANNYAEAKLRQTIEASKRDAEQLRSEMHQLEQQRTSIREQQLSADRRRRAMADRVTDLEAQVQRLEAEREQFELENKSLLNKLKVADIQPGVVEEMSKEIEELKARLAQNVPTEVPETVVKEYEDKMADLKREADERQAVLSQQIEDLKQQAELMQAMYNDMQKDYAEEKEAHQAAEAELEKARTLLGQVDAMQQQFAQVEELIQKRDERIEKLKASNKRLHDEVAAVKEQLAAAESPSLFGYEESSERADRRAEKMKDSVATEIAAIEDDFECPDWFVSEPDPNVHSLRSPDTEFGYTEPPRKPHKPDSDAQLSLF